MFTFGRSLRSRLASEAGGLEEAAGHKSTLSRLAQGSLAGDENPKVASYVLVVFVAGLVVVVAAAVLTERPVGR